ATMSSIVTAPSANLLADTIFANGLGAHPEGLVSEDETADVVQELLPLRQRMSPIMIAAHGSVDHKLGAELAMLNLAELQALRTHISLRQTQFITFLPTQLFVKIIQIFYGYGDSGVPGTVMTEGPACLRAEKLSWAEYVQVQEENADLGEVIRTRATADLVQ